MSLYLEGDVPYVANGNCNSNNGWSDWSWIIGLALVGGLFGGWGNGGFGFGFGGGRGGYGGVAENYTLATDFATIERKLDGVNNGLCDGFYAQNTNMLNGFASVQQTLCQGFNGIERSIADTNSNIANAICTLGYQHQAGFNQIGNLIQSRCCDLKAMNLENRYLNEKQTCDLITNQNANTRAILDYLTGEKISALQAENVALKGMISDDRQADRIINKLSPCPTPAYVVPNPNCCYNANVTFANPYNSGCGCC